LSGYEKADGMARRASTVEIFEDEYELQGRSCEKAYPGDALTTHCTHHIYTDTVAVDAGRRPLGRGKGPLYPGHRGGAVGLRPVEKIEFQNRHRGLPTRPTLECSTLRKNTIRTLQARSVKVTQVRGRLPGRGLSYSGLSGLSGRGQWAVQWA
jgi:hypothetical protein